MATVIRVKRRIDEEPLDSFVLNCKKRKYGENNDQAATSSTANGGGDDETTATVVKFAGTVNDQKNIASHLKKLTKSDAVDMVNRVRHAPTAVVRNRSSQKSAAQEDRFKIVNCYRTLYDNADDASPGAASAHDTQSAAGPSASVPPNLTVVDLERNPTSATTPSTSGSATGDASVDEFGLTDDQKYVYDLYLAESNSQYGENFFDDLLSLTFTTGVIFDKARGTTEQESTDESEDSNNEDNYRNDYPDTEEDTAGDDDNESVSERTMRKAFETIDIDDLSSEDDEDARGSRNGFVYSVDMDENRKYAGDKDRYGAAYARYKSRILKKNQITLGSDDDDDVDVEGNDDDDDNVGTHELSKTSSRSGCLDDDYYSD